MSAIRLHKLATIYLVALYGVVGVSGESLHYLATNATEFWSQPQSEAGETVVYYHVHGPDYHGHFHRHTHKHDHSDATKAVHQKSRHAAIDSQRTAHQPHGCPILTIVSTLKLGHSVCGPTSVILDSLVTPNWESNVVNAFEMAGSFYARGPPTGHLA
jgi:hypothetical protein